MIEVVLVEPEIPPNTGNIIRLCANTGVKLHLIEPLGFPLDHKRMRRAGLDYHEFASLQVHAGWDAFLESVSPPAQRCFALTTKGKTAPTEARLEEDCFLFFGSETRGLSEEIRHWFPAGHLLRLPMLEHSRSLNLSNAVAITVYEAWRQQGFNGAHLPPENR
ncbi:MAG: tRNA (uridine(34)/cytosine(34)/5-carboxymethylaminomethyluridine(34)-2'-O)-methyltransferase TrmL [Limnobacter sp.]|nr:tRNA (uridine(34)/cytosine(34)/5-carboxymethylaminomethyluridine(34)-2'-O)-methyltransferase TrmL [Limnobacter sp.]